MYLNRPYQTVNSYRGRVLRCLIFGAFVFLFLFVFRPFGLAELGASLCWITAGYGLVCTVVMLLLNVALVPVMPRFFVEESWTIGKELAWTVVNIFFIGLANALYTVLIGLTGFSWITIVSFEIYTLSLGVFPAAVAIALTEARHKNQFEKESKDLNEVLDHRPELNNNITTDLIKIESENAGESFSINAKVLLFVRAADNYAEVFFLEQDKPVRKVVRNTLKNLESIFSNEQFLRCHKSYLVNLNLVNHVSGNAQGYKLHLDKCEELIPVSRQLNSEIKERLAARP